MVRVFVDADACPVKDEVYVVSTRYGLPVTLVANAPMHVPRELGAELVVVGDAPDAADDWIAERAGAGDVVVTADIPLAARCLEAGARVLGTNGQPFTEDAIGGALAMRELKSQLRDAGVQTGGPRSLSEKDRSRFLSRLDEMVQRTLREQRD
ncbi:MAG: YaiI/YqxD family protein [Myxococcota bacterium]|nr:YaiI/YqxD family protein [Myxococcota bacterium]